MWDLPSWISPRIQYNPKRGSKARYLKSERRWACEWRTRQKLSDFNNAKWFAKLQFIKNSVKRVAEKFLGEQRMTNEMTRTAYPIVKYHCFGIFLVLLKFRSPLTVWGGGCRGRGLRRSSHLQDILQDLLSEWPTIQLTSDTVFSAVASDFTL